MKKHIGFGKHAIKGFIVLHQWKRHGEIWKAATDKAINVEVRPLTTSKIFFCFRLMFTPTFSVKALQLIFRFPQIEAQER